jgi:hypothetical protein
VPAILADEAHEAVERRREPERGGHDEVRSHSVGKKPDKHGLNLASCGATPDRTSMAELPLEKGARADYSGSCTGFGGRPAAKKAEGGTDGSEPCDQEGQPPSLVLSVPTAALRRSVAPRHSVIAEFRAALSYSKAHRRARPARRLPWWRHVRQWPVLSPTRVVAGPGRRWAIGLWPSGEVRRQAPCFAGWCAPRRVRLPAG